jgi:tRNA threonylcarbamoyl adenosine modification protein YeaZ
MSKKYILVVETVSKFGAVSLFSSDWEKIDELAGDNSKKLSIDLIGMISELLSLNNVTLPEIKMITAAAGPGSFTGLRVGWATIQGLSKGLGIPFNAVSLLDALLLDCGNVLSCAFVSIGGGKIAYKFKLDDTVKVDKFDSFLEFTVKNSHLRFTTIADLLKLFQHFSPKNASDNVINLIAEAAKRNIFTEKKLKYFE